MFVPCLKTSLRFVVVHRKPYKHPLMILTNLPADGKGAFDVKAVYEMYIRRWKIEEAIRFLKAELNVEQVRLHGYVGIRRVVLLMAVTQFLLTVLPLESNELTEQLKNIGPPFRRDVRFLQYRIPLLLDEFPFLQVDILKTG